MPPIPEAAADVTEADRKLCRPLIEAASFYAVDYERDGACWERVLPNGDCLVLAVWRTWLFGKPERKEWFVVRYTGRGMLGDETGPMTLQEALSRVDALTLERTRRRATRANLDLPSHTPTPRAPPDGIHYRKLSAVFVENKRR